MKDVQLKLKLSSDQANELKTAWFKAKRFVITEMYDKNAVNPRIFVIWKIKVGFQLSCNIQ